MYNIRRKLFSQNFLYSRKLVAQLVGHSSVGKNDLVLEIGPGKGIITEQLVAAAGHVVAVELDTHWYNHLQQKYRSTQNLTLYHKNFLEFSLPKLPYKVFANIPFAIEGKIIRKLLDDNNPPQDCYLVVMDKLAHRLLATHQENMFSVMHKPWFDFSIAHRFQPNDFSPIPSVHSVLFRFTIRKIPLLPWKLRKNYSMFVQKAFQNGQGIRINLTGMYPISKLDDILQKLSISRKAKPTHLKLDQWVEIYEALHHSF